MRRATLGRSGTATQREANTVRPLGTLADAAATDVHRNHIALKVQHAALMDRDTATSRRCRSAPGSSRSAVTRLDVGPAGRGRWHEPPDGGQRRAGRRESSVGTLPWISDVLGIGLPSLVQRPQPKPVKVTRAGEGAALWIGESGGRGCWWQATGARTCWSCGTGALGLATPTSARGPHPGNQGAHAGSRGHRHACGGGPVGHLGAGDGVAFTGDVGHSHAGSAGAQPARALRPSSSPAWGRVSVGAHSG